MSWKAFALFIAFAIFTAWAMGVILTSVLVDPCFDVRGHRLPCAK